jgi:hypothetical protein
MSNVVGLNGREIEIVEPSHQENQVGILKVELSISEIKSQWAKNYEKI